MKIIEYLREISLARTVANYLRENQYQVCSRFFLQNINQAVDVFWGGIHLLFNLWLCVEAQGAVVSDAEARCCWVDSSVAK